MYDPVSHVAFSKALRHCSFHSALESGRAGLLIKVLSGMFLSGGDNSTPHGNIIEVDYLLEGRECLNIFPGFH